MTYICKTRKPDYFYNADEATVNLAKCLRKKMTRAEALLWENLRRKNIAGAKFRRQHPIGFYIADFYCHAAKLVVEADGPIHEIPQNKEHDENRTGLMEENDIKVIRFTNEEILTNLPNVLETIAQEIKIRSYNVTDPTYSPLPF